MNYMEAVFEPERIRQQIRMENITWGHLYPKPRIKYTGKIVWTVAGYGGSIDINESKFVDAENNQLSDSPALFTYMDDFILNCVDWYNHNNIDSSGIHLWEGVFMLCKNGTPKFTGKTTKVKLI